MLLFYNDVQKLTFSALWQTYKARLISGTWHLHLFMKQYQLTRDAEDTFLCPCDQDNILSCVVLM